MVAIGQLHISRLPKTVSQRRSINRKSYDPAAELVRSSWPGVIGGAPVTAESGALDEAIVRIRKLFALAASPNEHEPPK